MTILSQAQAIRDATVPNSLTPDIVGDCLVDIANAIPGYSTVTPYIGAIISPDVATVIGVSGTYVPVDMGAASGNVSINQFTDNGDGTFVCDATDPTGYIGLYHVQVVMAAHTSASAHVFSACLGTDAAADAATGNVQTLTSGASKETQICLNVFIVMANGDTLGIWMTDETGTSSVYVTQFQMTVTRVGMVAL